MAYEAHDSIEATLNARFGLNLVRVWTDSISPGFSHFVGHEALVPGQEQATFYHFKKSNATGNWTLLEKYVALC